MEYDARNCLTSSHEFPAEAISVGRARAVLAEFAAEAGADQGQVDAVRLACSEALTNAVVHAYREGLGQDRRLGRIHVTAALVSQELWVLIADDGCGMEPSSDRPGLGLGLGLIAQLSDHMAIVPRATGGTEVQMRFDLVAAKLSHETEVREAGPKGRRSLA